MISSLLGYDPGFSLNQQYLIASEEPVSLDSDETELWYVYSTHPPQIAPSRMFGENCRPIVFSSSSRSRYGYSDAIQVWHHSSRLHQKTLKIFSLQELIRSGRLERFTQEELNQAGVLKQDNKTCGDK
jgi:hypothetical protein